MIEERPIQITAAGTIGADGTATVILNGCPSLFRRRLSTVAVQATGTARPSCALYRSSVAPFRLMANTRLGDGDTFVSDNDVLESGEPLYLVWTGGTVGATVRANLYATDYR